MDLDPSSSRSHGFAATRRAFLRQALSGTGVLLLAACAPAAAPVSPTATTAAAKPAGSPAAASASPAASPAAGASPVGSPQPAAKAPAAAGGYPNKPIEIIVPFNPGGGYDAVARQLAVPMQQALGQPVVVKNIPGGGTRIAARTFQQAPADGYTLGYFSDATLYADTLVVPAEGFDLTSWVWVAGVRRQPSAIFVAKDSPFKTIQDVVAADTAGQRIRFGHNGVGGYLPMQVLIADTLKLKNAAYVGGFTGTSDIVPALVRGDIEVESIRPISSVQQFIDNGDIRAILTLEPKRYPLVPDSQTGREANLPNIEHLEELSAGLAGMAVAPNTPADRVRVLEEALLGALKDPGFIDWAKKAGVEVDLQPIPGQEFTAIKRKEYAGYGVLAPLLKKVVDAGG